MTAYEVKLAHSRSFSYDALQRLTSATNPGGVYFLSPPVADKQQRDLARHLGQAVLFQQYPI